MDNAVATSASLPLVATPGLATRVMNLPLSGKLTLGLGTAGLLAVVLALTVWGSQGDYKVLFANLSDKDGGAIIAQLSQMNVPYKLSPTGAAIMVPAGQVHDLRLRLATAGLPKGSSQGANSSGTSSLLRTPGEERKELRQDQESELVRSIILIDAVENARVHLALPQQNGFFREQQKPSASVMLTLRAGRTLERAQIAGIVHLVASSVPEMNPKAVSILDQTGALLTASPDAAQGAGLDAQQLQYVAQIETGYNKRIFELLEPIVGRDNLRTSVTAELDFTQSEATSDSYKPNQSPDSAAIKTQQVTEQSGSGAAPATGIPGAASNQPPQAATAPLVGASQPLQSAQAGGAGAGNSSRNATTIYEVDRTTRVTRNATGTVKRLNAAVVVNNRSVTDAKGKTTTAPLTPDEIEKISALVREGIGFRQDRGDSVKVVNAPFRIDTFNEPETPWWRRPEVIDVLRAGAVPAGLALVAAFVFFGMVKPTLRSVLAPPPPPPAPVQSEALAIVDDENSLPALPAPRSSEKLERARQLAKDNPSAVANIVRGWVSGEVA